LPGVVVRVSPAQPDGKVQQEVLRSSFKTSFDLFRINNLGSQNRVLKWLVGVQEASGGSANQPSLQSLKNGSFFFPRHLKVCTPHATTKCLQYQCLELWHTRKISPFWKKIPPDRRFPSAPGTRLPSRPQNLAGGLILVWPILPKGCSHVEALPSCILEDAELPRLT